MQIVVCQKDAVVVGCEPVQEMNLVPRGTNEFFPQLVRLVANERHWRSHSYSHQKLGRRKQSGVSTELFLPLRRDPFPPVFVMETAENCASSDLAAVGWLRVPQ